MLSRIMSFYKSLRPSIDAVLTDLNFSPRHIALSEIGGGISLRYNISSSGLNARAEDEQSGQKVIFRVSAIRGGVRIEVPANRLSHYDDPRLQLVKTKAKSPKWRKIEVSPEALEPLSAAICADIKDYLLTYPSDFGCCDLYEKCSDAGHCLMKDQDMAAGCYYKRNLMSGRVFYGSRAKKGGDLE